MTMLVCGQLLLVACVPMVVSSYRCHCWSLLLAGVASFADIFVVSFRDMASGKMDGD